MTFSNGRKSCHKASTYDEDCMEKLTLSNENCVLAFDILLICSDYMSKHNLHIILKFESLPANYNLSVSI